jgi:hypothetical protein
MKNKNDPRGNFRQGNAPAPQNKGDETDEIRQAKEHLKKTGSREILNRPHDPRKTDDESDTRRTKPM